MIFVNKLFVACRYQTSISIIGVPTTCLIDLLLMMLIDLLAFDPDMSRFPNTSLFYFIELEELIKLRMRIKVWDSIIHLSRTTIHKHG